MENYEKYEEKQKTKKKKSPHIVVESSVRWMVDNNNKFIGQ